MRGSRSIKRSLPCPSSETQTLKPPSRNSCQTGVRRMLPSDRCMPSTATSGSSSRSPMSSRVRLRRMSAMVAEMPRSPLKDAFAHHVWATTRLIDTCAALSPERLQTVAPGTYGPILRTMQHLVGSDSWYLFDITGDRTRRIDPEQMDLDGLRAAIVSNGEAWAKLIATDNDPDVVVTEVDEDDG